ncbi:MAG: hypothetical protein KAS07_00035 [Candidatus Pacebacteria bacterium]|nr:hypothetical protein [Candidatus Paceibacterota bacterium]
MENEIKKKPIVIFLIVMAIIIFWGSAGEPKQPRVVDSSDAVAVAVQHVKAVLSSPHSADFPILDYVTEDLGDSTWEVTSYVDAQNAFGAEVRSWWTITVHHNGGDYRYPENWTPESLFFAGEKIY